MIKTLIQQATVDQPLSLAPLRCQVWRGQVLESEHEVHAALVNAQGELLASAGDPYLVTTARSSLKPFQLLPTLKLQAFEHFGLSLADIALMCASHNGESYHIQQCAQLLEKLQKSVDDLECGAHLPYHQEAAHELIRNGIKATAIHNNCSGKHCGMLALQSLLSAEGSYLKVTHPTQKKILETLECLLGMSVSPPSSPPSWSWGIDGCSLPTPAISLKDFAYLFAQLAQGETVHDPDAGKWLKLIFEAMSTYPELVAGTGRFDTIFMQAASGRAICKVGGEAIRGFALRDLNHHALGLVMKVKDGAMRALHPACLAFLEHLELIERPTHQGHELEALERFWYGVEHNWAGSEATKIQVLL